MCNETERNNEAERNKAATRTYFEEVLNNRSLTLIEKLLHPSYRFNGWPQSADDNAKWVQGLHMTHPNLKFSVEALLADDDKVAIRWRLDAPKNGDRPAGFIKGTNIITFKDGQAIDNQQNDGRTSPLNGY